MNEKKLNCTKFIFRLIKRRLQMPVNAKITILRCLFLILVSGIMFLTVLLLLVSKLSLPRLENDVILKPLISKIFPGNSSNHLTWFVQVSDIHVSKFYDKHRAPDLKRFIEVNVLDVIKPKVVLVTGDITDAKHKNYLGSEQYIEEWQRYLHVLKETKVAEKIPWLDTRGNHDAFNVPGLNDEKNLFRKYSSQGAVNSKSYMYTYKSKDGDEISFIAVDSCPDPGPKRPFNFFGVLTKKDLQQLSELRNSTKESNLTIWFGHYPTSTVLSPKPGFRNVLGNSIYMNGHLHSMFGYLLSMTARHPEGVLELELGDWKDSRIYRVFAVDHGLFSFTDEIFDKWPLVLITNPKHAQFLMPKVEPFEKIQYSSHIRFLVFSPWKIKFITVKIDDVLYSNVHHVEGPLYTVPWQANKFLQGTHTIDISVEDERGNKRSVEQPFSFSPVSIQFGLISRYVLMVNHCRLLTGLFYLALFFSTVPLIILRYCNLIVEVETTQMSGIGGCVRCMKLWIRRLSLVSKTPLLFHLLVGFDVYVALGPWFVGELIDGYIGVAFLHGLYVNGGFIPGTLTYLYGFCQIMTFNVPLTLYLARLKDQRLSDHKQCEQSNEAQTSQISDSFYRRLLTWIYSNIFFVMLLIYQLYLAYSGFYKAYGLIVLLLCPIRTWSVPFAIYLYYIASTHNVNSTI